MGDKGLVYGRLAAGAHEVSLFLLQVALFFPVEVQSGRRKWRRSLEAIKLGTRRCSAMQCRCRCNEPERGPRTHAQEVGGFHTMPAITTSCSRKKGKSFKNQQQQQQQEARKREREDSGDGGWWWY